MEVDSGQLELIALSLLAALGCGVAWTLDQNFITAIFAAESTAALVAAIFRSR
jgi:hypothetical protein